MRETSASAHGWLRHADYYVAPGQTPGQPGPAPGEEELRRGHWGWLRQAPSYPFILFIKAWRLLISPLYGQVCSFYPSCSAYGLEAVTSHGLIRGSLYTVWRILRCNPWSGGGIDHVPVSGRIWREDAIPGIIEQNHPPMDAEEETLEPDEKSG
ncbi:membrane protein insertion efficiency factor YidD [Nesterenkonia alba]|uniref:membrane protein insertion efficiency factor YidD n=1 Tax=Nesterenkonia alba TaxID=515814 RepID=UPI000A056B80|nr:membrane protein insertion efficiency factor YidD [Nesterenkonia alba]